MRNGRGNSVSSLLSRLASIVKEGTYTIALCPNMVLRDRVLGVIWMNRLPNGGKTERKNKSGREFLQIQMYPNMKNQFTDKW